MKLDPEIIAAWNAMNKERERELKYLDLFMRALPFIVVLVIFIGYITMHL